MVRANPIEKSGSLRVKPNWRYEALYNPASIKLQGYTSMPQSNAGCLKRFVGAGLMYEVHYKVPAEIQRFATMLPAAQAKKLLSLWDRAFKRSKQKKLSIDTDQALFTKHKVWNMSKVEQINDAFLVRAIKHVSNIKYDKSIAYALELNNSKDHNEIIKFMGYCFYAKVEDVEIAKRWNIPVKHVEALRLLFFDFSGFPKDRIANFTFLRQLANNGVISDMDFAYYKRVFEMGELGLRAQTDFFNLSQEDKRNVEEYLGKSVISNTLNLNFSVRNQKDAHAYGAVVSNLSAYYIKEEERAYFKAKTKNLDMQTRRLEGELLGSQEDLTDIDKEFMQVLREHSLTDSPVELKSIRELD